MRAIPILAFLVALTPALAASANPTRPAQPSLPILKLANAVVAASNADDALALSKLYTNDAIVVDEIPPFVWRGASAGVAWWHAVDAFTNKAKHTIQLTNVRISEFQRTANDAYLIQPMTIDETSAGRHSSESGTFAYTFHKTGGIWLISSQVWTTKP